MAVMLFGGFAPFFVTWLIQTMGLPVAPAFYVMLQTARQLARRLAGLSGTNAGVRHGDGCAKLQLGRPTEPTNRRMTSSGIGSAGTLLVGTLPARVRSVLPRVEGSPPPNTAQGPISTAAMHGNSLTVLPKSVSRSSSALVISPEASLANRSPMPSR
jgi:hypothetical protein